MRKEIEGTPTNSAAGEGKGCQKKPSKVITKYGNQIWNDG